MHVIGLINPSSPRGHRFSLAITDSFFKWAKVIPLEEVKAYDVVRFIKHHITYLFGVPQCIIHNNGLQFISHTFHWFCNKFRIQTVSSVTSYPPANGLIEVFNKTIVKLLKKFVSWAKRDWDDKLSKCLWTYRTTIRTPTKVTQFSLVYGAEAVLPLEVQIPSLRVSFATQIMTE